MTEQELAQVLAAVISPQRLHAELDARRHELGARAWPWWRVAVDLATDLPMLRRMRDGYVSAALRARAVAWLEREVTS